MTTWHECQPAIRHACPWILRNGPSTHWSGLQVTTQTKWRLMSDHVKWALVNNYLSLDSKSFLAVFKSHSSKLRGQMRRIMKLLQRSPIHQSLPTQMSLSSSIGENLCPSKLTLQYHSLNVITVTMGKVSDMDRNMHFKLFSQKIPLRHVHEHLQWNIQGTK